MNLYESIKKLKESNFDDMVKDSYNHFTSDLGKTPTLEDIADDIIHNYDQEYIKDETPEDSKNAINDIRYVLRKANLTYIDESSKEIHEAEESELKEVDRLIQELDANEGIYDIDDIIYAIDTANISEEAKNEAKNALDNYSGIGGFIDQADDEEEQEESLIDANNEAENAILDFYGTDRDKLMELFHQPKDESNLTEAEIDINKIIEDILKENKITRRTKASDISDDKFDNLVGQLKSKIPNKSEKELSNELSKYLFGHLDEAEESKSIAELYQYTKNSYGKAFFDFNPSDFDFNDYSKVGSIEYTPTGDTNQDLDQIFRLGNTEQSVRDANPEMHSISVSDIIKLNDKYYYVQAFGFEDITDKITGEPSQNVIVKVKDKAGREGYLSGDEDSLKFWIVDEPSQAQIFSNTRQDIKAAEYRARLNDLEVTAVIPD